MIWMDSYAKIHALTLGWVTCEDDLTDWTDETLWPLVSHTDIESMLWAMSAFVVSHPRLPLLALPLISIGWHVRSLETKSSK